MAMVSFRPHTIVLLTVGEGYQDSNGDYVPGNEEWSEPYPCRAEPNGKARTVPFGDDKGSVYDYTVYMDVDCPVITYGQKVKVFDENGSCIGEFISKGFHKGQLNAKLWI